MRRAKKIPTKSFWPDCKECFGLQQRFGFGPVYPAQITQQPGFVLATREITLPGPDGRHPEPTAASDTIAASVRWFGAKKKKKGGDKKW